MAGEGKGRGEEGGRGKQGAVWQASGRRAEEEGNQRRERGKAVNKTTVPRGTCAEQDWRNNQIRSKEPNTPICCPVVIGLESVLESD